MILVSDVVVLMEKKCDSDANEGWFIRFGFSPDLPRMG